MGKEADRSEDGLDKKEIEKIILPAPGSRCADFPSVLWTRYLRACP